MTSDHDLPGEDELLSLRDVTARYGIPASQVMCLGSEGRLDLCALIDDAVNIWCVDEEAVYIRAVGEVLPWSQDDRTFPREIRRKPSKPRSKLSLLGLSRQTCRLLISCLQGGFLPEYTFPVGYVEKKAKPGERGKRVEVVIPERNPDDPLVETLQDSGKWVFVGFNKAEAFNFDPRHGFPMIRNQVITVERVFVLGAGLRSVVQEMQSLPELAKAIREGRPAVRPSALSSAIWSAASTSATESASFDGKTDPVFDEKSKGRTDSRQPSAKGESIVTGEPEKSSVTTEAQDPLPETSSPDIPPQVVVGSVSASSKRVSEVAKEVATTSEIGAPLQPVPPAAPSLDPTALRRVRIREMADLYGFKDTKTVDARCDVDAPGYDPTYPKVRKDDKGKYWLWHEVKKHLSESADRDLVKKKSASPKSKKSKK